MQRLYSIVNKWYTSGSATLQDTYVTTDIIA